MLSSWTTPRGRTFFVGGAPEAGLILATSDGHTWQRMDAQKAPRLWWVFGFSDDDVWAVGQGGVVVHRGAVAWDLEATGLPDQGDLYKVWGAQGTTFAVGERGNILRRDPAGVWSRMPSGTAATLRTVAGRAADDVWAVGGSQGPVALHFDGAAWTPAGPGFGGPLVGVTVAADGTVFATSVSGELYENWLPVELGAAASLHFVATGAQGRRWAGGGTPAGRGVLVAFGEAVRSGVGGAPPARGDSSSSGGGTLGPGAACQSDPNGCVAGYLCYTLQYGPPICTHTCATATDCDDLGAHACCQLPEGQILSNICVPSGVDLCP